MIELLNHVNIILIDYFDEIWGKTPNQGIDVKFFSF
jgi:hypothetical protein